MIVDVRLLGDPALDLPKELVVYHLCLDDPARTVRELRIAGEAHGAARACLDLPGDFVECGVYRGDMTWMITQTVDGASA
jgi:hypothetical protein